MDYVGAILKNTKLLADMATVLENTYQLTSVAGGSVIGRAVTGVLRVSPNGNGLDGTTWEKAFANIPEALDAASTDTDDCTLILISPHTTYYDMDLTGDPTWAANVLMMGSHRSWARIKNTHASATSILKLTGKVSLESINFNLHTGSANGVILTGSRFRVNHVQFVGEDLTGAATALHIDGATTLRHGKVLDTHFLGHVTHMTGLLLDNAARNLIKECQVHECLTGIQVVHADSDSNVFKNIDIGDCALALDIDAGNEQHFNDVLLHNNTVNVDDEVGDHNWTNIRDTFDVVIEPDNFTGVTIACGAADTWGSDTEIRAAVSATVPFRIVAVNAEADAAEKFRVRFSADSGVSHYDDIFVEGEINAVKREVLAAPSGTEEIFNKGTRISASAKSESGGNNVVVWLELQEL